MCPCLLLLISGASSSSSIAPLVKRLCPGHNYRQSCRSGSTKGDSESHAHVLSTCDRRGPRNLCLGSRNVEVPRANFCEGKGTLFVPRKICVHRVHRILNEIKWKTSVSSLYICVHINMHANKWKNYHRISSAARSNCTSSAAKRWASFSPQRQRPWARKWCPCSISYTSWRWSNNSSSGYTWNVNFFDVVSPLMVSRTIVASLGGGHPPPPCDSSHSKQSNQAKPLLRRLKLDACLHYL